jgi:hypothetical protein
MCYFVFFVYCIVVPLPPGTYPLAVIIIIIIIIINMKHTNSVGLTQYLNVKVLGVYLKYDCAPRG